VSLDLTDIVSQVAGMAAKFKANGEKTQQQLLKAMAICSERSNDLAWLQRKTVISKTSWLIAQPEERLNCHYPSPRPPDEFSIIATDGSQIDVDRHLSLRCYIINIGNVILKYGSNPDAIISSLPKLYSEEGDLVIGPPDGRGREQLVEGTLLGIKRSVEECKQLASIAAGLPTGNSVLALLDGTLILWNLVSKEYPEFVIDELLNRGFIHYLDEIKKLNKDSRVAVASYISFPRSTDVINTLRVIQCPHEIPDCDRYCSEITTGKRECDTVTGIRDRDLFSRLLANGERSALFTSQSSIVEKWYGDHRIYFFYLKVDGEVARIEIPKWVVEDKYLLSLTHSLILDQCHRGHGYPVALSEAHQQAVVTGADRANFQRLIEMALVEENLQLTISAKNRSKKTRWI